jgi:hypothetical protein
VRGCQQGQAVAARRCDAVRELTPPLRSRAPRPPQRGPARPIPGLERLRHRAHRCCQPRQRRLGRCLAGPPPTDSRPRQLSLRLGYDPHLSDPGHPNAAQNRRPNSTNPPGGGCHGALRARVPGCTVLLFLLGATPCLGSVLDLDTLRRIRLSCRNEQRGHSHARAPHLPPGRERPHGPQ